MNAVSQPLIGLFIAHYEKCITVAVVQENRTNTDQSFRQSLQTILFLPSYRYLKQFLWPFVNVHSTFQWIKIPHNIFCCSLLISEKSCCTFLGKWCLRQHQTLYIKFIWSHVRKKYWHMLQQLQRWWHVLPKFICHQDVSFSWDKENRFKMFFNSAIAHFP